MAWDLEELKESKMCIIGRLLVGLNK